MAAPAQAASAPSGEVASVQFKRTATAGALTTIGTEYQKSRADAERGKDEKRAFSERSGKEVGAYYDSAALDFLQLVRADDLKSVDIVAPRDFAIESVDTRANDGGMVAIVGGSHASTEALAFPDGPGFEGLSILGSGSYSVKIYDNKAYPYPALVGENFSTWQKLKVTGDSDSKKDYYGYKRKAILDGKGYNVWSGGIRSYKKSGSLTNWVDWAPNTGSYNYNCNTPITAGASYAGVGIEVPFTVCSKYSISIATGTPGDMSANISSTTKKTELGFDFFVGATQGSATPVWNDYQKIGTSWIDAAGPLFTDFCDATAAGATCRY